MRAVILDNEAIQALRDPGHAKHRAVLAHLEGVMKRRRRGVPVVTVVPTAVRVEAGWDRSLMAAAAINRFRVDDRPLETTDANVAATISHRTGRGRRLPHRRDGAGTPRPMVLVSSPRTITAVPL